MSTRFIDNDFETDGRINSLANLSDVNVEEFRKRYMEKVKDGGLPDDNRTVAEKQADVDAEKLREWAEFFEVEDEISIDPSNPLETARQFSQLMEEGAKEKFELAEQHRCLNEEEDAAEKIAQVTEFSVNTDDPLLAKDYKEKKENLIKSIQLASERATQHQGVSGQDILNNGQSRQSTISSGGFSYKQQPTSSYSNVSSQTKTSSKVDKEPTYIDPELWYNGFNNMKRLAIQGGGRKKKERKTNAFYGGRKKFRFKNIVAVVKNALRSDEAKLYTKVGIALCLELALAIIIGKREFEGPGKTLAFLAMMMGGFYISRELVGENLDPRIISFV